MNGFEMNGLDWVLTGIGIFCIGRGLWRGAVSQVFGVLGILGGFLLASHYYQDTAIQLSHAFPSLTIAPAISFALLFLLAWFCIGAMGFWIAKVIHKSGLGFLDRTMGGAIGLGKALLLTVVLVSVLILFLPPQNDLLRQSTLRPFIQEAAGFVNMASPVNVQKLLEEKRRQLEAYWYEQKSGRTAPSHPTAPQARKKEVRDSE
jgi:membrane protein required for colicin V production